MTRIAGPAVSSAENNVLCGLYQQVTDQQGSSLGAGLRPDGRPGAIPGLAGPGHPGPGSGCRRCGAGSVRSALPVAGPARLVAAGGRGRGRGPGPGRVRRRARCLGPAAGHRPGSRLPAPLRGRRVPLAAGPAGPSPGSRRDRRRGVRSPSGPVRPSTAQSWWPPWIPCPPSSARPSSCATTPACPKPRWRPSWASAAGPPRST